MSQQNVQNPPGTGRRRRRRGGRGGAGYKDVFPQLLNMHTTETAANTYTESVISTPVVPQMNNTQALVMEIVAIYAVSSMPDYVAATETSFEWALAAKTASSVGNIYDGDVIMFDGKTRAVNGARTAEAVAVYQHSKMVAYDMTDKGGHGFLYGGQQLFLRIKGSNCGSVKTIGLKILYKLTLVNVTELIGMLRN